ncbi:MAG: hemolysin III family protein [Kordiimonadaceae bacterium]|nr:hemolysin III family protein [Kordiimonadaceae bacterium]
MKTTQVEAERAYSFREEIVHAATHGLGAVLAVAACVFLVMKAEGAVAVAAVSIYAASMMMMFLSSALYHSSFKTRFQPFFQMLDHVSIYFKIAGSYTPFALISLPSATGLWVVVGVWTAAATGTAFKLFAYLKPHARRIRGVSLTMYLLMGWAAVLMVMPLSTAIPAVGLYWLIAGGLFYTGGAVFYAFHSVAYFHAVWHVFVMAGSACHFVAIYFYVI